MSFWNRSRAARLGRGPLLAACAGVFIAVAGVNPQVALAQNANRGNAGAPGQALNPAVFPLNRTTVPDVNALGLLDLQGPNASAWAANFGGGPITNPGKRAALVALGKALFWDMQVGGDGIIACATCHYHAGADHRKVNQMSPGLKAAGLRGPGKGDNALEIVGTNGELFAFDFPLPVSQAALIAAGATPDDPVTGFPGTPAKDSTGADVNDVVSSQGIRAGTHLRVGADRLDEHTLAAKDDENGFTHEFQDQGTYHYTTVRRVEPRKAPTVLNAVYNFRNFWDGRADAFFNGVNPLGFRDPDARVKVFTNGQLGDLRLDIPFSSLASQAVGPIGSDFEMVFAGRSSQELGRKLADKRPLAGQLVKCDDSSLGAFVATNCPGEGQRGLSRGAAATYGAWVKDIFPERFWNAPDGVCLSEAGASVGCDDNGDGIRDDGAYTLREYNFALFFGLAVQAYEATLTTEDTIVDLVVGGKATGIVTLVEKNKTKTVNVANLSLEQCIAQIAFGSSAAQQLAATNACGDHYAKFIHPGARSGTESAAATFPVPNGAAIGGCLTPASCSASPNPVNGRNTLLNVQRGLGRFFAGATACAVCHFNPEFTGATVQAITGFGAGPVGVLPPGQVKREIEAPVIGERMVTFNGLPAVYDAGFYNLGVRPTPEDIALGDAIGGVPLSLTKLMEVLNGGDATGLDLGKITKIQQSFEQGRLNLPFSPTDLRPVPWSLRIACGPGLNNANANNNPTANCVPNVIAGERLLRFGAFKAQGLRNVAFTGPYLHNGSKKNLREVLEFYKTAGHFPGLNLGNLDAGMRVFALAPTDEAAVVELMETGLTDWRVAFESDKFDHPELCIPHGHDPQTGATVLVGLTAVGRTGNTVRLQTFEEQLLNTNHHHHLGDACTVQGLPQGL